jgi:hypothetical protein
MSTTATYNSQTLVIQASAINAAPDDGWVVYNTLQSPPNSETDARNLAAAFKAANPTKVVQLNSFISNITTISDTIVTLH